MPTPNGVGTTTFREVSVEETVSRSGMDSLTVTLRGAATNLAATKALWTRGKTYPGYPNMFLETRNSYDRSPVVDLVLTFIGFIDITRDNGVVDIEDNISAQSVTLNTNKDENVNFQYFAQSTTTRWIYRGTDKPTRPRFPGVVPSYINVGYLFAPDPPNYVGSISGRYKPVGKLIQFSRTRLAPSVWAVIETWENRIDPISA